MRFFILLFITLTSLSFAQETSREVFLRDEAGYKKYLNESCYRDLKNFYRKGKRLKSKVLYEQSKPISALASLDPNLEKTREKILNNPEGYFTFFHYTSAKNLLTGFESEETNRDEVFPSIQKNVFPSIMAFIKNPGRGSLFDSRYPNDSKGFFYVSSCPTCSSNFGDIQLSFTLSPNARFIDINNKSSFYWDRARRDLRETYPEVFGTCSFDRIGFLAIEDSGIDLIKYADRWYQLTNFKNVVNADALKFPKPSYELANEATEARARDRIYTLTPVVKESHKPLAIDVLEASWTANNDHLKNLKKLCDGKESCTYLVKKKFFSSENDSKPFLISWKCSQNGEIWSQTLEGNVGGESVTLSCENEYF